MAKQDSNKMDLSQIQSLIRFVSKSGASEVELETKDFKIIIKTPSANDGRETAIQQVPMGGMVQPSMPAAAPAPAPAAAPAAAPASAESTEDDKYITIKSPMIGTFYRSASPDKPPFLNVGDSVKQGDTVCIIEAMKLLNEIESEVSGKIVKVLVDDSSPVEYDQPLFLVDPS